MYINVFPGEGHGCSYIMQAYFHIMQGNFHPSQPMSEGNKIFFLDLMIGLDLEIHRKVHIFWRILSNSIK